MDTSKLKKFAQYARRYLIEQVSAKLDLVLAAGSTARRESPHAVQELERKIRESSRDKIVERIAYIWFNRFCALRFMDVNRYNRIGVISPAEGQFQPEILAEAKMGHIDEDMIPEKTRQMILSLLEGKAPSRDPQNEAYRLLVVGVCNYWHKAMPFLFQRISDYTELLMPDDLLSGNSILAYTREAMTPDVCEDVEVIGWLYQFYISEKKDEVFDGLRKNKKITPENIPAATQLFTPHWIVRYLVENSLGRLWLLNRPGSKLVEQMDYYIKPEQAETDFLRIGKPDEIKICDPACGSGHMLTYAFDLFYAIYEEEGYEPAEIPEKILTHNLYGIEIDERAGELAAFALTMKARAKQRRFFNKGVKPNICVLENVRFDEGELKNYMDFVRHDLFSVPRQNTLRQFEEADNFGSLIRPDVTDVDGMLRILESKNVSGHLFLSMTHQKVLQALRQADYLRPKYHVVIANPPYMGNKGMNTSLTAWAKENYPSSKSDLFAMFIERNLELAQKKGSVAMITMQSWMFLSSLSALRQKILRQATILSMAHLGTRAFDSIGGEVVSTTAFVISCENRPDYKGIYLNLLHGENEKEKRTVLLASSKNNPSSIAYIASGNDFQKIPGHPIAYWVSERVLYLFDQAENIGKIVKPRQGMSTNDNRRFLRCWYEIAHEDIGFSYDDSEGASKSGLKWFPYNKGGSYRKWYGNNELVVNWLNDGEEIKEWLVNNPKDPNTSHWSRRIINTEFYFKESITWSDITTNSFAARYSPAGSLFDVKGSSAFPDKKYFSSIIGLMNNKIMHLFMKVLNPTVTFQVGDISRVPFMEPAGNTTDLHSFIKRLISISRNDWDSYETSWDFTSLPLLQTEHLQPTLKATYQKLRAHWREITLETQRLEEENNRIFIDAYGLQDELTPEVPLNEITLTCNPHYRYGNDKSKDELEAIMLADTMRELVSYAVGCMFGRYALDNLGLILANQGETIEDYYKKLSTKDTKGTKEEKTFSDFRAFRGQISFPADENNVIPMLDGDWFSDDISEQFRKFLRVTFGDDHYEENLKFLENAIGKDIRKYFLKDFYNDHIKRYKKRPIYWLFSSPKGTFNALIYMHRYRPDTVSIVLNDYLREFRTKLAARKSHLEQVGISSSASQSEKTKALKEIEKFSKMIKELDDYEREVLYPLATEQVEIDLDDGVRVNYCKFGAALKKIPGLDAKEE